MLRVDDPPRVHLVEHHLHLGVRVQIRQAGFRARLGGRVQGQPVAQERLQPCRVDDGRADVQQAHRLRVRVLSAVLLRVPVRPPLRVGRVVHAVVVVLGCALADGLELPPHRLVLLGARRVEYVRAEVERALDFVLGQTGPHVRASLYDCKKKKRCAAEPHETGERPLGQRRNSGLTGPEERKRPVEAVLVQVREHVDRLRADLLVRAHHDDLEPALRARAHVGSQRVGSAAGSAHLVYETATRPVCHRAAASSEQSPLIDAEMDAAAASAPVMARWIPDEKNGSMNAVTHRRQPPRRARETHTRARTHTHRRHRPRRGSPHRHTRPRRS